jgi:multidrug resistance efflux pump
LLLALIFAPLLLLAWHLLADKVFITAPGVVTTEPMEIRSSGSGFVEKLLVESGDHVKKAQKLAEVVNPLLNTRVATLSLQSEQLNSQQGDFDQAVLAQLKGALHDAQEGMKDQLKILNQFKSATKRGIVSTVNMATVINALTASRLAVRSAKTELERERRTQLLNQVTSPLIQQRRTLQLALAEAQSQIDTLQPIANKAAVVAEILVREGDWVEESTPLFLLTQRRKPFVYAFLDARYASRCIDGEKVTIVFPSGTEMEGRIHGQTVLARRLPTGLAKPFETDKPALKVTVEFTEEINGEMENALVENLPVKVKFSQLEIGSFFNNP